MFNKVKNRIRGYVIGIGSAILLATLIIVYILVKANIVDTSNESLESAVNMVVTDTSNNRYVETEDLIFRIDDDGTIINYNDNYKRYDSELLFHLYEKCKTSTRSQIKINRNYFFYTVINLDGEYFYFVYDASLAMNNLVILIITLAIFFAIMIAFITLSVIYVSNIIVKPVEVTYIKQKEFMENASHELKTPLTIITSNIDSITTIKQENEKWVKNIRNQIARMNDLISYILELYRVESQVKETNVDVNLSSVLKKTIFSFEVLAYEKNISLKDEIEDNIIVKSKESNIYAMTSILLDNALKYASDNGYINISLKKERKKIYLIVENSGGNIKEGEESIIFERFYKRNDEDKSSFGLGLAILKAIVDSLDGEIKVECVKDVYTRFIIKI